MVRSAFAALLLFLSPALLPALPAFAAAGTTCLCRTQDNTAFRETTVRHHRWACDYLFGYLRGDEPRRKGDRPTTQTCNREEIVQWKVYRCISIGCTYPYAHSTETENKELKTIEPAPERRRP